MEPLEPIPAGEPYLPGAFFEALLTDIRGPDDILNYQMCEAWISLISAKRKAENAKLQQLEAAWKEKKDQLRPQLMAYLAHKENERGTMLGTTYPVYPQGWRVVVEDEAEAIAWIEANLTNAAEFVKTTKTLTDAGRQAIIDCAVAGQKVPGTAVLPKQSYVATRFRSQVTPDMLDRQRMARMLPTREEQLSAPSMPEELSPDVP